MSQVKAFIVLVNQVPGIQAQQIVDRSVLVIPTENTTPLEFQEYVELLSEMTYKNKPCGDGHLFIIEPPSVPKYKGSLISSRHIDNLAYSNGDSTIQEPLGW